MDPNNPYQTPSSDPLAGNSQPANLNWKQILFSFTGRIPRRVYWGYSILSTAVFYAIMGVTIGFSEDPNPSTLGLIILLVSVVPFIWMGLAILVKRWHDRGKSGAMALISLIPVVGPIWTFVECGCLRGTEGPNQYGGDPT